MRNILTLVLFLSCSTYIFCAVTLVDNSKGVGGIIIPEKAKNVVSYAARELQYHIKQASGATLPILTENQPHPAQNCIYLGDCKFSHDVLESATLPANGFIIKEKNNNLILAGRDGIGYCLNIATEAGSLFAVYDLLDQYLGVRWLWPGTGGEFIPENKTITLSVKEKKWIPKITNCRLYTPKLNLSSYGRKDKSNYQAFCRDQRTWMRRHRFRLGNTLACGHAFSKWWKRYGQSNPEFFNLLKNGKREPLDDSPKGNNISMCVSEPKFHDAIIKEWQHARMKHPDININACENDTPGLCCCKRCLEWDGPDPALVKLGFEGIPGRFNQQVRNVTERYAKFYSSLLAKARQVDPKAEIFAYAYANYMKAPKTIKLDPAITIGIVPASMYCSWDQGVIKDFFTLWKNWYDTGVSLFYRPNDTNVGHNFPVNYAEELAEKFQFAYQHGLKGTFFDSLTGQYATQGTTLYMLARLHNRPMLAPESILDEYYSGFGNAKNAVKKYFEYWSEVTVATDSEAMKKLVSKTGGRYNTWYLLAPYIFTDKVMEQGEQLLEEAVLAAKGDSVAEKRVEFLKKGFENARLTLAVQKSWQAYCADKSHAAKYRYEEAVKKLFNYRQQIETSNANNMPYLIACENRIWDLGILYRPAGSRQLTQKWRFRWDIEETGQDNGFYQAGYDDSTWQTTTVGAWEKLPAGRQWKEKHGKNYDGIAWYRTTFTLPETDKKMKTRLYFGSVDEACIVWVNGKKLLDRKFDKCRNPNSWQEPFEVDITEAVTNTGLNTLAVKVEDRAGNGGITRDVFLKQSPLQITGNVVRNGCFETGKLPPWQVSYPEGKPAGTSVTIDQTGSKNVCHISLSENTYIRLSQSAIPLQQGMRYRFSAMYKTSPEFTSKIKISLADGSKITPKLRCSNSNGLWQTAEKSFTASSNQLYLLFSATGKGDFRVSNIVVYPEEGEK